MRVTLFIILLFFFLKSHTQIVGPNAYVKGNYIEFAVRGTGGHEGVDTTTSPVPITFHPRPTNSWFGILANPQMNNWMGSAYDGDFMAAGVAENGWGFEITNGFGPTTTASNNGTSVIQIPGAITGYANTPAYVSVDWEGTYLGSGYDLDFHINYNLYKNDLFYTTTVSVTNNGVLIPEYYYYRTIDPDNNLNIGGPPATTNTIMYQPDTITYRAQVSAQQSSPWNSVISFVANGAGFKASLGGFAPRSGSNIWNGTGGTYNTLALVYLADEAISLAYKISNFAAGSTETFHYFTVFADSLLDTNFEAADLSYIGGGTVITNDSLPDSVYACGSLQIDITGYGAQYYDWTWSPNTYLNTDTGISVISNPLDTITYTVTGTPIGLGATQVLSFTVIPSVEPVISITTPAAQCATYDLNTLVYTDLVAVSNAWSFHSDIPDNAFDITNYFSSAICTPYDSIYLMMLDSTTGCFDVDFISIPWQDVLFDITVTTTACDTNSGTASLAGITAAPGTYSILWSTGDTTNSVSGLPAGPISCDITGPGGCVTSNSISVQENSIAFLFNVIDAGCGNPNGSITTTMYGNPGNTYSYSWSNGDTTADLINIYSGLYSLTVTNQDGCTYFDTVTVQNIVTTFSLSTAVLDAACSTCANGSIYTFLSGAPILPVTYVWNNGATTPNIFGLLPGTYYVTATDAVGCTYADTFYVGYPGTVMDLENSFGLTIFPNPVSDELQISALFNMNEIKVTGVDGRIIAETKPLTKNLKLNVSDLVKGVYLLHVNMNNKTVTRRFVKL